VVMKVEEEIRRVVEETLSDLANKEGVIKPDWKFGKFMAHRLGKIMVDLPIIKGFWETDAVKARVYLRHSLAHEFHHYLEYVGPKVFMTYFKGEPVRDEYACKYIGLSAKEFDEISDYLWEKLEELEKPVEPKPPGGYRQVVFHDWWKTVPVGAIVKWEDVVEATGLPRGVSYAFLYSKVTEGNAEEINGMFKKVR